MPAPPSLPTSPPFCLSQLGGRAMENLDLGGPLILMAVLGLSHLLVRPEGGGRMLLPATRATSN